MPLFRNCRRGVDDHRRVDLSRQEDGCLVVKTPLAQLCMLVRRPRDRNGAEHGQRGQGDQGPAGQELGPAGEPAGPRLVRPGGRLRLLLGPAQAESLGAWSQDLRPWVRAVRIAPVMPGLRRQSRRLLSPPLPRPGPSSAPARGHSWQGAARDPRPELRRGHLLNLDRLVDLRPAGAGRRDVYA